MQNNCFLISQLQVLREKVNIILDNIIHSKDISTNWCTFIHFHLNNVQHYLKMTATSTNAKGSLDRKHRKGVYTWTQNNKANGNGMIFKILKPACFSWIMPLWLWCVVLFICYWIQFENIWLSIFCIYVHEEFWVVTFLHCLCLALVSR